MAKRRGKKSLEKAVKGALGGKRDKLRLVPALMGAYVNGQKTLGVANRPDFVWVRLRGATSEVAQAFNDIVGEHWDLPILIKRDEFAHDRWRVHGRDIRAYEDWGGVSYLPPHAMSHSFGDPDQTGGVDPVWIFKRQFMPLLPRPEASGTMSLYLEPDFYYFEGQYHWWPGSGTTSLLGFVPTGASNAKFVTIYLDGELGIPQFIDGEEFNFGSYGPWGLSTDFGNLIALPNPSQGIPIAAVRLYTGSTSIGWGDIYDLRSPQQPLGTTGSHISIFDESVYKGAVEGINFIGDGLEVVVSGTYAHVFVTGTGGGGVGASGTLATYSLVGIPEPVDSITGAYWRTPGGTPYATGSINAFIDGISQVIGLEFQELHPESGTYQYLETPPTGTLHEVKFGVAINVTVGSEGATGSVGPQGPEGPTGTQGPQGIEGATGVQGPQGDIGTFGVFVTDEGAPIGTGTILDFIGEGVDASISGTVVRIFITGSAAEIYPPVTGTVVLYDEQSILGSVEKIVVEGDPAYAAITGAFGYISISGSVGPQGPEGATGSVGPQGAEGATGSAGAAGAEGATGSQGIQGIEGATGSQGIEGATGSQGIQGIEGATGSAGQTGPPGAEGATGSVGPQGVEGATGSQGIQGIEGATGSQGIEGATGSVGPQGIEGA
ncbi:MAG: collagen-like protein, partial [Thermoplasmata archaeon]|nr:collagen-like protein [Thermoplasmata archaeon]